MCLINRPAYMDEYERLEVDLQKQYAVYVEKHCSLSYLEHQLDIVNQAEQSQNEVKKKTYLKNVFGLLSSVYLQYMHIATCMLSLIVMQIDGPVKSLLSYNIIQHTCNNIIQHTCKCTPQSRLAAKEEHTLYKYIYY